VPMVHFTTSHRALEYNSGPTIRPAVPTTIAQLRAGLCMPTPGRCTRERPDLPRMALVGSAQVGRSGRTGYDPIGSAAGTDADDWVQVRGQEAVEFGAWMQGPAPDKVLPALRQPSLRSPGPPSGRICCTYPRSVARSPEGERGSG
jgi:hypothetical protein